VLTLLWALPAAAALALALARGRVAWIGPLASGVAFLLSLTLWSRAGHIAISAPWIGAAALGGGAHGALIAYRLGLSGLSLLLVALALLLTALTGLAGLRHGGAFVAWLTMLGAMATGLFLARDLVLFYVFWELTLVPTYFLLVGWGGQRRRRAAWRFLIYNVAGSVFLLLAVAALTAFGVVMPGLGVSFGGASPHTVPPAAVGALTLALFTAFAVKTPIWPVQGWVADTYSELPAPAAALVAGIQSKLGLYGMLAVLLPLLPRGVADLRGFFVVLSVVSLLFGAWAALAASDARRLLAYSSVSHLSLVMLAFLSLQATALAGGILQLVAHGLFTAGLFLLVGMLEARLGGPVQLAQLSGLARRAPALAGGLTLLGMAALGLPGLAGFPGELMMLVGIYRYAPWVAVLAALSLVLAAVYVLRLIQLVLHGPEPRGGPAVGDLRAGERWLLLPLAALVLWVGIFPQPIPARASAAVQAIGRHVARAEGGTAA
jgi:NADH-quinone oxidoreductase subunit M